MWFPVVTSGNLYVIRAILTTQDAPFRGLPGLDLRVLLLAGALFLISRVAVLEAALGFTCESSSFSFFFFFSSCSPEIEAIISRS